MKLWVFAACLGGIILEMPLSAQTSFQVLEQELQTAKQQHDDAASQFFTTFIGTLDAASQSPSQALDLYKQAGGNLPDAAPVRSHYEYETPSEKAIRDAQDAQNFGSAAAVIEVHCGLMHYAALLTLTPKAPGLHDQWLAWLKATGDTYPQLSGKRALKDVPMKESVISHYLGFHGWDDKDPGKWSISDLPRLYREQILEPTRVQPSATTLDLWDTYIAMRQADETDKEKWQKEDEPALDFDRGADDFAIAPSMEKLSALIAIIKANPANSQLDDWIARMRKMIRSYRDGKSAPSPATALPGATPGTPSSQVGDSTPVATPGTPSSATGGVTPTATPGAPSATGGTATPAATPGSPTSATGGVTPTATPGTPASGGAAPTPAAR